MEKYTYLNAEFQRLARRDRKVFLNDQCRKQQNGKDQRTLQETQKGTFHAKMGTIKDRNGMDLTEAEDIKKRWQEYTKNNTKKIS